MDIYQYLQQLENGCNKSLSQTKNHGVRGAKIQQLQLIKQIREKLQQLDQCGKEISERTCPHGYQYKDLKTGTTVCERCETI